jgi:hypothetical protein
MASTFLGVKQQEAGLEGRAKRDDDGEVDISASSETHNQAGRKDSNSTR